MINDPRHTARWRKLAQLIYERDGRECVACQTDENLSIDHIEPVSETDIEQWFNPDNMQVMCMPCNRKKSNKTTGQTADWWNPTWLAWEKAA
jgi:5-methylcytosine-specific restriction endonuclease McrA